MSHRRCAPSSGTLGCGGSRYCTGTASLPSTLSPPEDGKTDKWVWEERDIIRGARKVLSLLLWSLPIGTHWLFGYPLGSAIAIDDVGPGKATCC